MLNLVKKLKTFALFALQKELETLKYFFGQNLILTSRANSANFVNLWDAEVKVYSQWGEDGILDYLCERSQISKPNVLEIGAGNFQECNSRFLAENRNANVFAVDGREDLIPSINRSHLRWKTHLFGYKSWVTPQNIGEIIKIATSSIGKIDIFSLDVDGNDFWILKAIPLMDFKIVVVEYNPLFGHSRAVAVPRDDYFDRKAKHHSCLYYGASLKAYKVLMESKGFKFVGTNRVGNNAFFVNKYFHSEFPLSVSEDLSVYTDWRIRESRSTDGKLSLASGSNRVEQIALLPLIDIESGKEITVEKAN